MTREEAIEVVRKNLPHLGIGATEMTDALETLIPELRESEDERIRKLLVWQVYRNIEDETNDLAQSVYDGIKGHDPDIEESIEDWKRCLAWLEKQKEQKPIKWTDLTWKDIVELEGIINNVHYDFSAGIGQESFGKEVLERFRSTKGIEYLDEAEQKCWQEEEQKEQKSAEWSEEDERKRLACIETINEVIDYERERWEDYNAGKPYRPIMKYDEQVDWLKSLRPDSYKNCNSRWKPSEEQMAALEAATVRYQSTGLESLYEDLKKL